jgi:glycosyltransferase involved in cell wall biosynthesis
VTRPRLIYLANNRLPTEKAHGLQIVQMCEAFVQAGYAVTLVTSRRINTPEMRAIQDIWVHYGVEHSFEFRQIPCLDLISRVPSWAQRFAFLVQLITYLIALGIWLLPRRAEVIYTRELFIAALVKLTRPRTRLVYEVHQMLHSRLGTSLQCWMVRRVPVVPVTAHLAEKLGAKQSLVAHDGFRAERFAALSSHDEARRALGLPAEAFVVGYAGRLHTMQMSKGVDTLVEAIARSGTDVDLLLVGGPEEGITVMRQVWIDSGLPAERLHAVGQVAPDEVPRHLAAMDVGTLLLPWTEHFAYYASAIKLFEYMAAGCVVLASNLPSTAEVVRDGESALLVPPGDIPACADAIRRLVEDRDLCAQLRAQALQDVQQYTWAARANRIRQFIESAT